MQGVVSVFTFWLEYIKKYGKPLKIYLDKHSTYKNNAKTSYKYRLIFEDDPMFLTQFQRATNDLNIELIHAHSPQAKGRVERLFGTLQDRLVKELRLANISNIEEANEFVEEIFLPKFNEKFSVVPVNSGDVHRNLNDFEKQNLDKIFSIQDYRIVNNDFTIRYENAWFQLLKDQPCLVLRKEKVLIEKRLDGNIFISLRNKYLNFKVLPERPNKVCEIKITALSNSKKAHKPAPNHPWRKSINRFFRQRSRRRFLSRI